MGTVPMSRQRPGPIPLSPNSEAARARARSIAASNAARISAANRRLRSERVALETRASNLAEELENRRSLAVKYLALQIQEDILTAKKLEKDAAGATASQAATPIDSEAGQLSPMPSPKPLQKIQTSTPSSSGLSRGGGGGAPTSLVRKRGRPPGSGRGSAIARQQPLIKTPRSPTPPPQLPGTPDTLPAVDSDEEKWIIHPGETPPKATQFELQQLLRKERMMKDTTGAVLATPSRGGKRPGRPRGGTHRQTHTTTKPLETPISRGRGRGGRGRAAASKPRLSIRTPNYLLKEREEEKNATIPEASSPSDFDLDEDEETRPGVEEDDDDHQLGKKKHKAADDGKLYCLCKTSYDPAQ